MWTWPLLGRSQTWSCRMKKWDKEDGEHSVPGEGVTKGRCWCWKCPAHCTSVSSLPKVVLWLSLLGRAVTQWAQLTAGSDRVSVCSLQLHNELEKGERESAELQEFANAILQQIADHCPDILEQVVNALEESSWPRPPVPRSSTPVAKPSQSTEPWECRAMWKTENGIETSGAPFTKKTKAKKTPLKTTCSLGSSSLWLISHFCIHLLTAFLL